MVADIERPPFLISLDPPLYSRIGEKMKIRLEKPALNNFKTDRWKK